MVRKYRASWGSGGQTVPSGTGTLIHGTGCLVYLSAWETTGLAIASVAFYDGNANNGELVTQYNLLAGESTSEEWGPHWLVLERGLYVVTLSGAVAGSFSALVDHNCVRWLSEGHWADKAEIVGAAVELGASGQG